jgi:hypothetical protein
LKLVFSHTFLYKKLDEFGHNHNSKILEKVKNESARLLTLWDDVHGDQPGTGQDDLVVDATPRTRQTTTYEADHGRKIVFDNFDFHQKVHHMSEVNQNIDNHWVVHMNTENRVSGNHLSMVEGSADKILQMDNGKCLPDRNEHATQRDNYADLVSRIVVDNINCLEFLKAHATHHIKHPYSREMAKPTETVSSNDHIKLL